MTRKFKNPDPGQVYFMTPLCMAQRYRLLTSLLDTQVGPVWTKRIKGVASIFQARDGTSRSPDVCFLVHRVDDAVPVNAQRSIGCKHPGGQGGSRNAGGLGEIQQQTSSDACRDRAMRMDRLSAVTTLYSMRTCACARAQAQGQGQQHGGAGTCTGNKSAGNRAGTCNSAINL